MWHVKDLDASVNFQTCGREYVDGQTVGQTVGGKRDKDGKKKRGIDFKFEIRSGKQFEIGRYNNLATT
jgi:hypothetical protein